MKHNRSHQLTETGTAAEVTEYVNELSCRLREVGIQLAAGFDLPRIPGLVATIMGYIATQGLRMVDWLREPHLDSIDLIAHTTRNLFEACLIHRHLLRGNGQHFMHRITGQVERDELDIITESLRRFDPDSAPEALVERRKELEASCPPKVLRVPDLAKEAGWQQEYESFYKLFSKYSHPSIYLMAGDRRTVYSQQARLLLAQRAAVYLESATNDFERLLVAMTNHESRPR